jgi:hypothetical protein
MSKGVSPVFSMWGDINSLLAPSSAACIVVSHADSPMLVRVPPSRWLAMSRKTRGDAALCRSTVHGRRRALIPRVN